MGLIWISLLLLIIVYVTYCMIDRRNKPPGPFRIPILGHLIFMNKRTPYKLLFDLSHKYGSIYGLYLGSIYTVVLSDVQIIRDAFKREEFNGRAPLYITHGIMGGYGIICAEGPLWKDQRRQSIEWLKKLGMSKFGTLRSDLEKRIKAGIMEFMQLIEKTATDHTGTDADIYSLTVDPKHILHHSLGNIVNSLVFGVVYAPDDATWKYLQHLQEEGVKHIGVSGVVNFLPILRFLPANKKTMQFLLNGKRRTHAIYDEIIENARSTLAAAEKCSNASESESKQAAGGLENAGNSTRTDDGFDAASNATCILKYFLCEKEKRLQQRDSTACEFYNDKQLRHLLADLFGAGVDTTFTSLRWFLLYMARDVDLQRHLRTAIIESCAGDNIPKEEGSSATSHLSLSDLEKLDLLKACVSETLRIRPAVPLGIPHGTSKKTTLCGYEIPQNTMVVPLQWAVHMDPRRWRDPESFDPKRFLDEEGRFSAPPNFIPFQAGKRVCIGEELARMMMYLFTATFVTSYEFTLAPEELVTLDMTGNCGITLTPPDYTLIMRKLHH